MHARGTGRGRNSCTRCRDRGGAANSGPESRGGFAARPGAAERWVKTPETPRPPSAEQFTARLTIDVTPDLRRRLKLVALQRGVTVADMLRALFEREFPTGQGDPP